MSQGTDRRTSIWRQAACVRRKRRAHRHTRSACAVRGAARLQHQSTRSYHVLPILLVPLRISGSLRAQWQRGCQENCDIRTQRDQPVKSATHGPHICTTCGPACHVSRVHRAHALVRAQRLLVERRGMTRHDEVGGSGASNANMKRLEAVAPITQRTPIHASPGIYG